MEHFSLIATLLTQLTWKGIKFEWDEKCEQSFEELENRLIPAPILALSTTGVGYVVFNDASRQGLRCVLLQGGRMIVYAFSQLKKRGTIYLTHKLEWVEVDLILKI